MQLDDMMAGATQYRAAVIEDIDVDKSEILVRAAPYGAPTDIGAGVVEEFRPGTFSRAAKTPHRLGVWSGHGGPLIGRGLEVDDREDGIWIRSKIARTQAAKDALLNIEDGISDQVSVEFVPKSEYMDVTAHKGGLNVVHRRAHLLGWAVVPEGAYGPGGAFIAAIRADDEAERKREAARLWLEAYRRRVSD